MKLARIIGFELDRRIRRRWQLLSMAGPIVFAFVSTRMAIIRVTLLRGGRRAPQYRIIAS